jgi:hypothetical protein
VLLLAIGAVMPQTIVLVAGVASLAGGGGTLAGQRRRVRV